MNMVKMVEALLIGGPCDGDRITVAQNIETLQKCHLVHIGAGQYDSKSERYNRSNFHIMDGGKLGEFLLFTHESLPTNSIVAIQLLIDGYRKPKTNELFRHDLNSLDDYPRKNYE